MTNILFICSRNQWRSPTAEHVFSKINDVNARSAGTSKQSRRKITAKDIAWADKIVVMETKHKQRIIGEFKNLVTYKDFMVLNIPDDYQYMDPELIDIFEHLVEEIV